MTAGNFAASMKAMLAYEGGKVDDPHDPGGRTNQGVTKAVYDAYRRRKYRVAQDVFLMSDAERDEVYRDQYWDEVRGDDLPAGVEIVVFDGAVNSGVSRSAKWLQAALGVTADGAIGAKTLAAASAADPAKLVGLICDKRLAFLKGLGTWSRYGKGWSSRVADVRAKGLALAKAKPIATPPVDPAPSIVAPDDLPGRLLVLEARIMRIEKTLTITGQLEA